MRIASKLCCTLLVAVAGQVLAADADDVSSAALVKSQDAAVLSSQKSGKLLQRNVREGESFKQGAPLLAFDCAIDEAELSKARSQQRYAQTLLDSNQELRRLNSLSDLQYAQSEAELQQARADVTIKQKQVEHCIVKAPYDGQLIEWHVQAHETVQANSQLVSIVNNNNLLVEFIAPSSSLQRLQTGAPLQVYINERSAEFAAVIERVIPSIDSVSQTVKVIARFTEKTDALWAGMSGKARLSAPALAKR